MLAKSAEQTFRVIGNGEDEWTLLHRCAQGKGDDEKVYKSQKIRQSEPRRTLNKVTYPDVQWRGNFIHNRIHERGVSIKV